MLEKPVPICSKCRFFDWVEGTSPPVCTNPKQGVNAVTGEPVQELCGQLRNPDYGKCGLDGEWYEAP